MAQDISTQLVTLQLFNNTLGYSLSTEEFQHCLQQIKFINPKVGKFWQGTDAKVGIYIAIAGKVRLLDSADELIATLKAGDSFGEFTLFKEGDFKPYAARASVKLQLCFVSGEVLCL
ncbi:cyclic nucleotide-binding domain-containing protein [Nostoc sp.]|uniref:cyclic nucleotide-binding domain-containing protein n=1 Tax=Nostoc sp. TaxID=1180 RepID=UPI002FF465AC